MKLNVEDTEKERLWTVGLPFAAKLLLSRGSSCSSESFLEDEMPDREEEEEVLWPGEEEAREANSSESRGGGAYWERDMFVIRSACQCLNSRIR